MMIDEIKCFVWNWGILATQLRKYGYLEIFRIISPMAVAVGGIIPENEISYRMRKYTIK